MGIIPLSPCPDDALATHIQKYVCAYTRGVPCADLDDEKKMLSIRKKKKETKAVVEREREERKGCSEII